MRARDSVERARRPCNRNVRVRTMKRAKHTQHTATKLPRKSLSTVTKDLEANRFIGSVLQAAEFIGFSTMGVPLDVRNSLKASSASRWRSSTPETLQHYENRPRTSSPRMTSRCYVDRSAVQDMTASCEP